MSIEIDAYCERWGQELNIYQELDGSNFRVDPCEDCIRTLNYEIDALQRNLDIAVEALNNIDKHTDWGSNWVIMIYSNATWTSINSGFATTNIRTIAQSLSDPKLFYAGTNGSGLYQSRDAGETWEAMPPVVPTQQG